MTEEKLSEKRYFFNGINGSNGRYLLPPLKPEEVAALAREDEEDIDLLAWLKEWNEQHAVEGDDLREPVFGNDAKDLSKTGWGVIFAPGTRPRVERALDRLLEHRKDEATRANEDYFKILDYEPEESVKTFLRRHGARPDGAADPDRGVPYHLLLVGDPEKLSYRFQYELDVRYAVGRIHFNREEDYERYAENVIAAEKRPLRRRQVTLFGTRHTGDPATEGTADKLIQQLGRTLIKPGMDWTAQVILGREAVKDRLAGLLGGPETPALLLAACHGVGFPDADDPRLLERQGGLICQDWPGPDDEVGVLREDYFAWDDLKPDQNLRGLVAFLFACYSAGTPDRDSYYDEGTFASPRRLTPLPFVSRLCQSLLCHPKGALAVVGHVDRAWTASFQGSDNGEGVDNFQNCLRRLLEGHTVGAAVEFFNQAYATLSALLSNCWEDRHNQSRVNPAELADLWLNNNDARNFVVFGDPAVKLSVPD